MSTLDLKTSRGFFSILDTTAFQVTSSGCVTARSSSRFTLLTSVYDNLSSSTWIICPCKVTGIIWKARWRLIAADEHRPFLEPAGKRWKQDTGQKFPSGCLRLRRYLLPIHLPVFAFPAFPTRFLLRRDFSCFLLRCFLPPLRSSRFFFTDFHHLSELFSFFRETRAFRLRTSTTFFIFLCFFTVSDL